MHLSKSTVSSMLFVTLIASILDARGVSARTWRIRPDGSGDAPTIQAGIDSAAAGDDVLVGAGRYTWTSQDGDGDNPYGPTLIELRSHIVLHSESGPSVTILDAEGQGRVVFCRFCDTDTRIEGFTITGGRTIQVNSGDYKGIGGGIYCQGGGPEISGNIVRENYASKIAGGIGMHFSSPVIRNNFVLWNRVGFRSGGIELNGNACVVEQNTIVGNWGGGIGCVQCGGPISRNIIAENGVSDDTRVGGFAFFCIFEDEALNVQCNITWHNTQSDAICGTDAGGNVIVDPRFCAPDPNGTGILRLRPDSPALPENNDCHAVIGATSETCATTDVPMPEVRVSADWSLVKLLYR